MKKTFLPVIMIIILVFQVCACSNSSTVINDNEIMRIIYIDNGYYNSPLSAKEGYLNWNKNFNEKFNTQVEIIPKLTSMMTEEETKNIIKEIMSETNGEGILIMPVGVFNVLAESRDKYFSSMDDSIYTNSNLFEWPVELVDYGKNPQDGKLWCLPVQYWSSMNFRAYNKKYFDEMGIEEPKSIEDFKGALNLYKTTYDKQPIYIDLASENPFDQFSDIFSIYGIDSPDTIIYDYETGEYKNIIDMDGIHEILEFINGLYEDGLISTIPLDNGSRHAEAVRNGDIFTAIIQGPYTMKDDRLYHINLNLNADSIVDTEREAISHVAVVLKYTLDGNSCISDFIEMFLSPGEEFMAASIGFEGIHYTVENSRVIPVRYPSEKRIILTSLSDIEYDIYGLDPECQLYSEYKKAYRSDQHRIQPYYMFNFLNRDFSNNKGNINIYNELFSDVFVKIFSENQGMEALMDEYKQLCKDQGVEDFISDANMILSTYR